MTPIRLTEHVADWRAEFHVDSSARIVRNITLAGRESKNGYRYSDQALSSAVALYEHKPVFLDHAGDRNRPHDRSARDLVGSIVNPRFESGRIKGDIQVLDTDSGRTFLALASSEAPGVGMSHVVLAARSADKATVEKIHDVVSVDAVVFPATTNSLRESVQSFSSTTSAPMPNSSVSQTPSSLPDSSSKPWGSSLTGVPVSQSDISSTPYDSSSLPTGASSSSTSASNSFPATSTSSATESSTQSATDLSSLSSQLSSVSGQLAQVTAERNELLTQLECLSESHRQATQRQQLDQKLLASGLPEFALTETFRQQFTTAPNDSVRLELIRERKSLLARASRLRPASQERNQSELTRTADAQFLAAIKRR